MYIHACTYNIIYYNIYIIIYLHRVILTLLLCPTSPFIGRYVEAAAAADHKPIFWWITAVVLLLTVSLGRLVNAGMRDDDMSKDPVVVVAVVLCLLRPWYHGKMVGTYGKIQEHDGNTWENIWEIYGKIMGKWLGQS